MNINFINNEKYTIISKEFLNNLKEELQAFKSNESLNNFQKWILNDLYDFNLPNTDFTIESILLIAVPHPFYSKILMQYNNKQYNCLSLVSSDFDQTRKNVQTASEDFQFKFIETDNLPLKRLAVQSGLALYGRNNITYVEGLGSSLSYIAFFTTLLPKEISWRPVRRAFSCRHCRLCIN